jgi:hypothetical protein
MILPRDAPDTTVSFRVFLPRESVGKHCGVTRLVYLLPDNIEPGEVTPADDVVPAIRQVATAMGK